MIVADIVRAQQGLAELMRQLVDHLRPHGHDLTGEQAVLVAALPDDPAPVGMLRRRAYAGTNISYNLKKLEDLGYVLRDVNLADQRSAVIGRSNRGNELADLVRGFLADRGPEDLARVG